MQKKVWTRAMAAGALAVFVIALSVYLATLEVCREVEGHWFGSQTTVNQCTSVVSYLRPGRLFTGGRKTSDADWDYDERQRERRRER